MTNETTELNLESVDAPEADVAADIHSLEEGPAPTPGELNITPEMIQEAQQNQLKQILDNFTEEQRKEYETKIQAYLDEVDGYLADMFEKVKAIKMEDEKIIFEAEELQTFVERESIKAFGEISNVVMILIMNGKLDESLSEKIRESDEKMIKVQLIHNSVKQLPVDQIQQLVNELDERLLYAAVSMFSFQTEQMMKTVMRYHALGELTQSIRDEYLKAYENIYNKSVDYLTFNDINVAFIRAFYQQAVETINSFDVKEVETTVSE